jgi:hypothetical protein
LAPLRRRLSNFSDECRGGFRTCGALRLVTATTTAARRKDVGRCHWRPASVLPGSFTPVEFRTERSSNAKAD